MADKGTPRSLPWRRQLVFGLILLVGLSVAARLYLAPENEPPPPGGASSFAGQQPQEEPPPRTGIVVVLPFVTEGGIAMILGIALGVATGAILRISLLLVIGGFVLLQVLAYKGVLTVDWTAMGAWLADFILNVTREQRLGSIVQHKLPTAGALLLGYVLGLKRN
ncbi:MAG: FUN14 domain-containing protein [Planctomycetota bacterium]